MSPAAESAASSASKELQRLQQEVGTTQEQLEAAEQQLQEQKAEEKEIEGRLEDAKAQLQVGVAHVLTAID